MNGTMHSIHEMNIPGVTDTANSVVTEIQAGNGDGTRHSNGVFSKAKEYAGRLSRTGHREGTGNSRNYASSHSRDIELGDRNMQPGDKDGIIVSYEVSRTVEDVSKTGETKV